jgi:hypothetical protein
MNSLTFLLFYGSFFLIVIIGLSIYSNFKNRKNRPKIISFINQTEYLKPSVLKDISIKYLDSNHYMTRSSPNGKCDLYIFDNFIAIIRRQKFIFTIEFEPLIIKADDYNKNVIDLNNYLFKTIDRAKFTKYKNDELIIKLKDENFTHFKTEITLRKLKGKHIDKLRPIENWKSKIT